MLAKILPQLLSEQEAHENRIHQPPIQAMPSSAPRSDAGDFEEPAGNIHFAQASDFDHGDGESVIVHRRSESTSRSGSCGEQGADFGNTDKATQSNGFEEQPSDFEKEDAEEEGFGKVKTEEEQPAAPSSASSIRERSRMVEEADPAPILQSKRFKPFVGKDPNRSSATK